MADNTPLNGVSVPGGDTISTDELPGGEKVQRVKVQKGSDGVATDIHDANPLPITPRDSAGTEIGTAAAPIRTDPTGTTPQPVSDGGGSLTVDGTVGISGTVPVSDGGGSLTVDAASLPLPGGASTAANQTAAQGTEGVAHGPSQKGVRVMGTDGTNDKQILTDAAGRVQMDLVAEGAGLALAANQLPDGHNVTIDNADGASAVPIKDGGNSLTVDDGGGSLTVDAASLPLPNGAATEATLAGDLNLAASHTMNEFRKESVAMGGQLDDVSTALATEGGVAPARITEQRAIHVNLRDSSGTEIAPATAVNQTAAMGTDGAAGPASAISIAGTESGGNLQEIRTDADGHLQVDVLSGGGGGTQYTEDDAAPGTPTGTAVALKRQDTPATVGVDGDIVVGRATSYGAQFVQVMDTSGNPINSFGGSGGTSHTDDAPFSIGSASSITPTGYLADETTPDSVDEGDVGVPRMTTTRKAYAVIADPSSEFSAGVDSAGRLQVDIAADSVGIGGGTQYTEDAAAPADPVGPAQIIRRQDTTATSRSDVDGDNVARSGTQHGSAFSTLLNTSGAEIGTASTPVRTDPTGTTTQPVSGSVSVSSGTINATGGQSAENAAVSASPTLVGGRYDSTPRTLDTGDAGAVALDAAGRVKTDGSDVTQPVSAASLPLPSGAATAAGQLPDGHNVTVDNGAGVSAVNIQDGGNSITVDGTVSVSGTVTTDGSGVTQPVSAASLPLPTGAATAANQTSVIGTDGAAGPASAISIAGTESGGNLQEIRTDADGHLQVDVLSGGGGGTQYTEDAAAPADPVGPAQIIRRQDTTATSRSDVDGDNVARSGTQHGSAFSTLLNTSGAEIGTASTPVRTDPTGTTTQPVSVASALPAGGNNIGDVDVLTLPGVAGTAAHDAAVSGNPVTIGARANANEPTAVGDGDATHIWADQQGRLVTVQDFPANVSGSNHGPYTTTRSTAAVADVLAAKGAGQSIHVTSLAASNTSGTKTRIDFYDGATVKHSMALAADGGGFVQEFKPPWKLTANTALRAALGTAVTDIRINVHFFVAP